MCGPARFSFLNSTYELDGAAAWNRPGTEKLALYNLHYFDDLNAEDAAARAAWHRALIERWVLENPPGSGTGWEPYPLSVRVVNWIKWSLSGHDLGQAATHSLAIQARYLNKRLERHLFGNHLFTNAKALVFAGCHFKGHEAIGWLRNGMRILEREVPEQILGDGGHFERSTMYHALALEDMLDLVNLSKAHPGAFDAWRTFVGRWASLAQRMARWLAAMCHPDGEISFFNDSAIGIAPSPAELFAYSQRLGHLSETSTRDGVTWLKESGYVRAQRQGVVCLIDVAPIGPDYLPGHAHADTLSFELSLGNKRVIVNSGTSRYGLGPQREFQRSTGAHCTVAVDGQNSSEVWAAFRVARRAYPFDVAAEEIDGAIRVRASHDGYSRLPGRPMHTREWLLLNTSLTVSDTITGEFSTALARYFLHPDVCLNGSGDGCSARIEDTDLTWEAKGALVSVARSLYFPEFGIERPSSCVELEAGDSPFRFRLSWASPGSDKRLWQ